MSYLDDPSKIKQHEIEMLIRGDDEKLSYIFKKTRSEIDKTSSCYFKLITSMKESVSMLKYIDFDTDSGLSRMESIINSSITNDYYISNLLLQKNIKDSSIRYIFVPRDENDDITISEDNDIIHTYKYYLKKLEFIHNEVYKGENNEVIKDKINQIIQEFKTINTKCDCEKDHSLEEIGRSSY